MGRNEYRRCSLRIELSRQQSACRVCYHDDMKLRQYPFHHLGSYLGCSSHDISISIKYLSLHLKQNRINQQSTFVVGSVPNARDAEAGICFLRDARTRGTPDMALDVGHNEYNVASGGTPQRYNKYMYSSLFMSARVRQSSAL